MTISLLVALLAKSAIVALLGLGLSVAVARLAADRADVLRATVCLLIALPLMMAFGPALSLALLPEPPSAPPSIEIWSGALNPVEGVTVSGALLWPSMSEFLALVWTVGALVVAGRFAAGVWTLARWTREARPIPGQAWQRTLQDLPTAERPVLKASDRIASPLSWGLPPGAVLIDPATLARPQTAAAVMAHEMAHVQRRDWLFLVLSRLALALFWFNPLVWLVHRSLIERSEEAADALAVGSVDRHDYARALIGLAATPGPLAATAMAGNGRSLRRRIATLMSDKTPARRPFVIAASVAALVAVATPIAALELHAHISAPPMPAIAQTVSLDTPPAPPPPPRTPRAPRAPTAPSHSVTLGAWTPAVPPAPPPPPAPPASRLGTFISPPAPPAPPLPPVPPAPSERSSYVYMHNGRVVTDPTPEERASMEEAERAAANAQRLAADARRTAAEALRQAARARQDSARHAEEGRRAAAGAREQALAQARVATAEAHAAARVNMRLGAENMRLGAQNMRLGAQNMRGESRRLNDPAYRALQIRENAERGNTVTDAELRALAPTLLRRANEMDQRAREMDGRASGS